MAYSDEDKKMMRDALEGRVPPPEVDPDNDPHLLLNYNVPTEGGMGSGSGEGPDATQPAHPGPPPEAPNTPRPEGPSTNDATPVPAVSVSGSGEPNAPIVVPPVTVSAPAPPAQPAGPPAGLVSHQPGAAGGQSSLAPPPHIGIRQPVVPKPPDYSGVQTWQDRLEAAQQEQIAAVNSGDTARADALQKFKDDHAAMVRANTEANEEAHQKLLAQQAAQEQRWQAFQSREIDPDHYVHNMPGWQKAISLAAITIGGALEGFQGTPNRAMEAFQEAIGRDIDAQKANFERDARVLQHGDNLYAQNYQMYRDDAAARAATEADHWQMAKWELENLAEKSNDDEKRAQYKIAAAQANQHFEEGMARAGQTTALVAANKKVVEARKQAEALQAQVLGGLQTGPGYAAATGQPAPKSAGGGGAAPKMSHEQAQAAWEAGKISDTQYRAMFPAPTSPKTQVADTKQGPPPQARVLDAKEESQLVDMGDGTFAISRTAPNKATGESVGNRVYSIQRPDGSRALVEADEPVRITSEILKGGQGRAIRPNILIQRNEIKQAVEDLKTVDPGLKFGEEGERAAERYNLIARSSVGREMGLKEIDVSSSDLWDRNKGALIEAIGHLKRSASAIEAGIDEAKNQTGAPTPAETTE